MRKKKDPQFHLSCQVIFRHFQQFRMFYNSLETAQPHPHLNLGLSALISRMLQFSLCPFYCFTVCYSSWIWSFTAYSWRQTSYLNMRHPAPHHQEILPYIFSQGFSNATWLWYFVFVWTNEVPLLVCCLHFCIHGSCSKTHPFLNSRSFCLLLPPLQLTLNKIPASSLLLRVSLKFSWSGPHSRYGRKEEATKARSDQSQDFQYAAKISHYIGYQGRRTRRMPMSSWRWKLKHPESAL